MKSWNVVLGLLVAAIFLSIPAGSIVVFGQAEGLTSEDSVGIQVTPVIDEFDIKPGQTLSREIKLAGLTKQTVRYYPVVLNFEPDPETGKPVFYNNEDKFIQTSISKWITFSEDSFVLTPGEKRTLTYTVNAPSDATAGGHYGAVLLSTEEPKLDGQGNIIVGVVGLIGTLVLATVPGDITEQLVVTEFKSPSILFSPPGNFELKIKNIGNVHLRPRGGITIRNWLGKQVHFLAINESEGAILPNSQRHFSNSWQFNWLTVGKYTANLSLSYGSGQNLNELRSFYVIPYWLLIAVAGIIILWISRKRLKRRPKTPSQPPTNVPPRRRVVMG